MSVNFYPQNPFTFLYFSDVGYSYWLDERQRRRRNGLPLRRSSKHKEKVPSYFYTVRIRNPLDVAANERPVFTEEQFPWKGTKISREHVQSDDHSNSELRKWWFTRSRKFYSSLTIVTIDSPL